MQLYRLICPQTGPEVLLFSIFNMGIEESIKQIIANELAEIKEELTRLRVAVEDKNAMRIYMTTADVAREFGITPKTIIQYEKDGLLKCYRRKPGGPKYFLRNEAEAFLFSPSPKASRILKRVQSKPLRVEK